jgi:hypothetical protein
MPPYWGSNGFRINTATAATAERRKIYEIPRVDISGGELEMEL